MNQTQMRCPWPDWRITQSLGGGSYGAVYEIQRGLLDGSIEKAAMKIISIPKDPSEAKELLNSYDRESVNQRYLDDLKDIVREYSLMAQMKGNINIVHCEDMKHEPKADGIGYNLYIKMELLTPLSKVLTNPISEAQVVKVGMDLCNALAACRKKNVIHRDIKPANIMVSSDGHYKLGDFGIAKTSDRTAGGTFAGTPNFMAPEVYQNKPYGAAVDIYSLGMVLYWMLNEHCGPFLPLPPTMPKASQIEEAKQRRMNGEALPAPKYGSRALQQIVLKACAPRAENRYNSPEAMYEALAAICGESSREESSCHRAQSGATPTNGAVNKDDASMGNAWEDEYNQSQGSNWSRKSDFAQGGTVGTDHSNKSSSNVVYGPYDIKANLTITAQEAAQGCRKEISIGQKTISVHVPVGTSNGQILRLRGLGKTDPTTGVRGTLYLQIKIDQSTADFWKQDTRAPQRSVCISTQNAKNGGEIKVKFQDGSTGKLNIPAGCENGQIVDSIKVYVHNSSTKTKKSELANLPDVVLKEYAISSGSWFLYIVSLLVWGFVPIFPVRIGGLAITWMIIIAWSIKWRILRKEAERILKIRKSGNQKNE